MQKEVNERLDIFLSTFIELIKDFSDETDGQGLKESDYAAQIPEIDKRFFLISESNFQDIIFEVVDTARYNLENGNPVINTAKAFKSFFKSFKDLIINSKEVTNQINDRYKHYSGNGAAGMQVEEAPSESEEDIQFDDEVEFFKVYSNRPRGSKNTKGNNNVKITLAPENYGFDCLYVDPVENQLSVIAHLKSLEHKFSLFLKEKGYFNATEASLVKDVYRVGRAIVFDTQVQPEDCKNVYIEQLQDNKLKTIQVSFEQISNQIIYSGQCLVLRTATINTKIIAREVIHEVPQEYRLPDQKILAEEDIVERKTDCNVLVIKGPFFDPDRHDFAMVFSKLKSCISKANANVVIVKGPVISQNYKKFMEDCYEDTKAHFIEMLNQVSCAHVVYVNEASEKSNVMFLPINPLFSYGRIIQAPNPCIIDIDGFRLGISDEKLLDEMALNSFSLNESDKTRRFDLAVDAIHQSQSLLPLYNNNIFFDWSKYNQMLLEKPVDAFFIHSNKFNSIVKKIESTQYVNLKSFTKPSRFGSYAFMKLSANNPLQFDLFECEENDE